MNSIFEVLEAFILQAHAGDLKTSTYPKEWNHLQMKVSFGQGVLARVPWIALYAPEMQVSQGFYPVYLFFRAANRQIQFVM
jgi:5-methylcytosine-specific restriction enzyme B